MGQRCWAVGGEEIDNAPDFVPDGRWKVFPGRGVTAPDGFQASGVSAGLRASSKRPDLALVYCPEGAVAAGVFTKNLMCAAPVTYCKDVLEKGKPVKAVLINAGQANAATGSLGWQDALDSAEELAKSLGIDADDALLQSTGVIGQRIKMKEMLSSIPTVVSDLSDSDASARNCATAITTTDLVYKSGAIEVEIDNRTVTLGGMCKGSGMIHPNMATMLGVVTCDAEVDQALWQKMLKQAVDESFNQITVDGDTSTNDTVVALASGKAGNARIEEENSADAKLLQSALTALCQGLGKSIAWDGEGANVLLAVNVQGAKTKEDARVIARSVTTSSLTKSAIFGQDPNWGRIAAAAGYAGPEFDVEMLDIKLGATKLMEKGQPLEFDAAAASAYLKSQIDVRGTVDICVVVGDGPGSGVAWGCDLSYDYVKINAEYTT
ncbi:arginine biosynthesis bifunctional protein ArgJ [Chloropicon primus]|uniref:Arginine biosynthesis bifunctional protein ArgJ, chloroplastic n=1 Tax=Chloropicon primus TaxID=1764295 RepID=A0A5B8MS20_9CHLO|nr:arginine biosynthesis bifunctional protein ArgJ [Chloropicon primus]UPR02478.1 arginine biosynthesis bifunctional protein ArgJ [Chloropicon primus]|eukprot:QDZ23266.1 arginine biosynthesis bifunctional protein ArgJ [Chloropicon primus]